MSVPSNYIQEILTNDVADETAPPLYEPPTQSTATPPPRSGSIHYSERLLHEQLIANGIRPPQPSPSISSPAITRPNLPISEHVMLTNNGNFESNIGNLASGNIPMPPNGPGMIPVNQMSNLRIGIERTHTSPSRLQQPHAQQPQPNPQNAPERNISLRERSQPNNSMSPNPNAQRRSSYSYIPNRLEREPIKRVPDSLCVLATSADRKRHKNSPISVAIVPNPDCNTLLEGYPGLGKAKIKGIIRLLEKESFGNWVIEAIKTSFKVNANLFVHFGGVEEEGLSIANGAQFQKYAYQLHPTCKISNIPDNLIEPHRKKVFLDTSRGPLDFPFEFRIPDNIYLSPPCNAVDSKGDNTLSIRYELKVRVTVADYSSERISMSEVSRNFLLPHFPCFRRDIVTKARISQPITWISTDTQPPNVNSDELLPPNIFNSAGEPAFNYNISLEPQIFGPGDTLTFKFSCKADQYWKVKFINFILIEEWTTYASLEAGNHREYSHTTSNASISSLGSQRVNRKHNGYREILNQPFKEDFNGQFWGQNVRTFVVPSHINADIEDQKHEVVEILTHRVVVQIGISDRKNRKISLHNLKANGPIRKERSNSQSEKDEKNRKSSGTVTSTSSSKDMLILEAPVFVTSSAESLRDLLLIAPELNLPPIYASTSRASMDQQHHQQPQHRSLTNFAQPQVQTNNLRTAPVHDPNYQHSSSLPRVNSAPQQFVPDLFMQGGSSSSSTYDLPGDSRSDNPPRRSKSNSKNVLTGFFMKRNGKNN
ncbi:hypothetical protein HK098_007653 [Nowakowskiella sp. JEL0407]|nr:hypothetical protein HK098_007653 [Nowakowskiella sp. JEL0407]